MLVGLGGNNGTTLAATILANRHNISWGTRDGIQTPNYIGSLVRASTMRLGVDAEGNDVNVPMSDVLPMVHPNDLVVRSSCSSFPSRPSQPDLALSPFPLLPFRRSAAGTSPPSPSTRPPAVPKSSSTTSSVNSPR